MLRISDMGRLYNIFLMMFFVVAILVFATSCATYTTDFVTGQKTRNFYSVNDDIRMGNQTFAEIKAQMAKDGTAKVSTNQKDVNRVESIANRIFDASGQRNTFDFSVTLFESEVVNAFAVPGGKIAVFSGIWHPVKGLVTNDDELAAVIAHEVAHVTCRHSTEALTRQMPAQLVLTGLGIFAAAKEDPRWEAAADATFQLYNGLVVPKYSRADEFEADRVSMQYMARAGFDPAAAVALWKRAYEKEGGKQEYMSKVSTHPSNQARYEALQRQLPAALALKNADTAVDVKQPRQTVASNQEQVYNKTSFQATERSFVQENTKNVSAEGPPKALPPQRAQPPEKAQPPKR